MNIDNSIIDDEVKIIELIKSNVNPINYIENEKDIDLICNAISKTNKSEDSYFDDMADILLKAIIYYLISNENELKTLGRCQELVTLGINDKETIKSMLNSNESSKALYTGIDIASDNNYKEIFKTLNNKLSNIK